MQSCLRDCPMFDSIRMMEIRRCEKIWGPCTKSFLLMGPVGLKLFVVMSAGGVCGLGVVVCPRSSHDGFCVFGLLRDQWMALFYELRRWDLRLVWRRLLIPWRLWLRLWRWILILNHIRHLLQHAIGLLHAHLRRLLLSFRYFAHRSSSHLWWLLLLIMEYQHATSIGPLLLLLRRLLNELLLEVYGGLRRCLFRQIVL